MWKCTRVSLHHGFFTVRFTPLSRQCKVARSIFPPVMNEIFIASHYVPPLRGPQKDAYSNFSFSLYLSRDLWVSTQRYFRLKSALFQHHPASHSHEGCSKELDSQEVTRDPLPPNSPLYHHFTSYEKLQCQPTTAWMLFRVLVHEFADVVITFLLVTRRKWFILIDLTSMPTKIFAVQLLYCTQKETYSLNVYRFFPNSIQKQSNVKITC